MDYKKLSISPQFSKFVWVPYPNNDSTVHDFGEKYEKYGIDLKPYYNPYTKSIFEVNRKLHDIYECNRLGGVSRGFIISDKLRRLLLDYILPGYVIFDRVILKHKGQQRDDYYFIYLYENFYKYIDYKNSVFWLVDANYRAENMNDGDYEKLIYDKDFKLISESDYSEKFSFNNKKKNRKIRPHKLCIPEAMQYDIFGSLSGNFLNGVFVSERLKNRMISEKILGLEYATNIYFTFECPPHIKVELPPVGNTYFDEQVEIDIKSKKEIKANPGDLRKKLENRYKQTKTYFEKNTLKGSIDKFLKSTAGGIHISYTQDGKERIVEEINHDEFAQPYYENLKVPAVNQVIEKLKEGFENLEAIIDKIYLKSELRKLFNNVEEINKKTNKNYNCLVFDLDYDGACDVQIIMDEDLEIASKYNYNDINAVYEYAPSCSELAQHLFQILEDYDYAGLQELFEDVPYIEKLSDMVMSKIYIILHDCIDEMSSGLTFEKAHYPLFVFAKDKYSDNNLMGNIYIFNN